MAGPARPQDAKHKVASFSGSEFSQRKPKYLKAAAQPMPEQDALEASLDARGAAVLSLG